MILDHPQLKSRLDQVLGEDVDTHLSELSALNLQLRGNFASAELRMNFREGNIPLNFKKKSRNCLIFFLDVSNFDLEITSVHVSRGSHLVDSIKTDELMLGIGKYQYKFLSSIVHFNRMQSVNQMDLVDREC